ncbi:uncharacterized protein B0H18DRAFT_1009461 [Fomitopsis serialis]|uniref:uncharacterized protein n=1 Tax=Fomitopsis serialis TaxID=139415 RepID=UPI00200878A6|nr:uncharacterized protein B0H18DRAFT_1009461 [Neoantrodia serialis]KAH9925286.1 hypothetical protein B0H18DRAFT_1009461 [Neoantrodia serialis]
MNSPELQCRRLLPSAGSLPPLCLRRESPYHPRAFFVVLSESAGCSAIYGEMNTTKSAPPGPSAPRTPPRGQAEPKIHSTPLQPSAISSIQDPKGSALTKHHVALIHREYTDKIRRNVDVEDFVRAVFRFGWSDIHPTPYRDNNEEHTQQYSLGNADIKAYRVGKELSIYTPFNNLANGLLCQLYGPLPDDETPKSDEDKAADKTLRAAATTRCSAVMRHRHDVADSEGQAGSKPALPPLRTYPGRLRTRGHIVTKSKHKLGEKPDLTYSTVKGKPVWEWELVPVEVQKTNAETIEETLRDMLIGCEDGVFSAFLDADSDHAEDEEGLGDADEGGADADEEQGMSDSEEQQGAASGSASKRKRGKEEGSAPDSKRARTASVLPLPSRRTPPMSPKEVQVVKYVNQIMSSNVRSYAVGWLIEETKMRLVYGDRMGLIFTKEIDFLQDDAALFLLIVAATGAAGVHDLGIHPALHFRHKDAVVFSSRTGYVGAKIRLDVQEEQGMEEFVFDVDVTKADPRAVYTEFGLIGRGTTVIPVKAEQGDESKAAEKLKDEPLVAKVAWPHKSRQAEDKMIRAVRQCLVEKGKEKYLDHVVDLKCSVTKSIEEMGLPRVAMGVVPEEQDLRVCRTLILRRYERLETIGSQKGFHTVFVHVVRAHYWVYETSRILHRDISTNNIMWFMRDGEIIGVLCDWDLAEDHSNGDHLSIRPSDEAAATPASTSTSKQAGQPSEQLKSQLKSRVNSGQEPAAATSQLMPEQTPRYRTGTGPFMALDLLRSGLPPIHKYRHDLESFFYIYAYTAAAYDPVKKRFGYIAQWQHSSLVAIGDSKRKFLMDATEIKEVFSKAHEDFKPLLKKGTFLMQFLTLFGDLESRMDEIEDIMADIMLVGPTDGVRAEVEEIERERDAMVTYSAFMEILGSPEDV